MCSDIPHCGDCKKDDKPPDPGEPCNCNDYGAYNDPKCGGDCNTACGEECQFAFLCPSAPNGTGQGCYQCKSTCTCTSKGESEPGTDCEAEGYDLAEDVQVSCGENCGEISCIHCACYTCTEYEYVDCGNPGENCPSGKETPVPPVPGSFCPSGCCTCDPVPEEDCDCGTFGAASIFADCREFGYDQGGTPTVEGPCVDKDGNEYDIYCTKCSCAPCGENGWAPSLDYCLNGDGDLVMPGTTSDLCPQGCWECNDGFACGVCDFELSPCACCPSETGTGDCCSPKCCCPKGQAPVVGPGGPCICVPA